MEDGAGRLRGFPLIAMKTAASAKAKYGVSSLFEFAQGQNDKLFAFFIGVETYLVKRLRSMDSPMAL
jgi:hypothetical protein